MKSNDKRILAVKGPYLFRAFIKKVKIKEYLKLIKRILNMKITRKPIQEIDAAQQKEDLKKLEAVFFISGRFLSMQELISLSDLNPIIIRELIEKLQERYNHENSATEIVEKNGLWKMDVKSEYHKIVSKLATGYPLDGRTHVGGNSTVLGSQIDQRDRLCIGGARLSHQRLHSPKKEGDDK